MDAYVEVCERFEEHGIRYVLVGVFAINFYARQVGEVITTADCDILIAVAFPKQGQSNWETHLSRFLGEVRS
jgi:hypothetical protein